MSNGHRLELAPWGNGEVHLTFWDSLHGKDVDFVLHRDGSASRAEWTDDSDDKSLSPVNLVSALLELNDKLYGT